MKIKRIIKTFVIVSVCLGIAGQSARDAREVLARTKDFATTLFKTKPTYLGDFIDIHGDGDVTND